ncbi:MAG: hypothetical protein Tsb0019_39420 [Roseibium sp.]
MGGRKMIADAWKRPVKLAAALCLAVFATLALAPVAPPVQAAPKAVYLPQIEGVYSVEGLNPNGSRYVGRVTITVKNDTAFFRWEIAGDSFHGQGPLTGTTLIIDWGEDDPVIYRINADGTLFGTWANGRASETLRPIN